MIRCHALFRRLPKIELCRFKQIEFFPGQEDWSQLGSLCLATKSRALGDALVLSSLPRQFKAKYPKLEITTYIRAFNPVVFFNNPFVSGLEYLPDQVFGDDCNLGAGHLIELKEQFFGLDPSLKPKPEIFLTAEEKDWSEQFFQSKQKPLCILHPWGATRSKTLDASYWENLVQRYQSEIDFCQVGVEGHRLIPGCAFSFLSRRDFFEARKLFSLLFQAQYFIGVDSAPMHIARAFDVPSLILVEDNNLSKLFEIRSQSPYFLNSNWSKSFLYSDNTHLSAPFLSQESFLKEAGRFFC